MSSKIARITGLLDGTPSEIVVDMEAFNLIAPKGMRDTVVVYVDQTDATVFTSGDSSPVTGGNWSAEALTDKKVILQWPFSGLKIVKGAANTTYNVLGHSA